VWSISVKRLIKKTDVGLFGEEPVPVLHFSPYKSPKKKKKKKKKKKRKQIDLKTEELNRLIVKKIPIRLQKTDYSSTKR